MLKGNSPKSSLWMGANGEIGTRKLFQSLPLLDSAQKRSMAKFLGSFLRSYQQIAAFPVESTAIAGWKWSCPPPILGCRSEFTWMAELKCTPSLERLSSTSV